MKTELPEKLLQTAQGQEANDILRSCVHCGFCNATCPTYQILGDELDGPRGRIYQIKNALEGRPISKHTQLHLDRCLTCLNCETTCPSGVQYHRLLDIGRAYIEQNTKRKSGDRLQRWLITKILPYSRRVTPLIKLAQWVRPVMPKGLASKIPRRQTAIRSSAQPAQTKTVARKIILLQGCVQPAMTPRTNQAVTEVCNRVGITVLSATSAGCCGALSHHINATEQAKHFMRRNIDAWWPMLESGVEALVASASGCGVHLKEYATLLADDPDYADKAKRIAELARDLCEIFSIEDMQRFKQSSSRSVAFHPPCTLQHGQQLSGRVESLLEAAGFTLLSIADAHLCCGSAGVYSVLQADLANQLKQNKLENLQAGKPDEIVTANIGCQLHLQSAAAQPVKHWIELLVE